MSRRILVVDDSSTVRHLVERTLVAAGFEVAQAADGREGLEMAMRSPPDLVLVDFVMPLMNGFQLCQAMRATPSLANVPVVLVSAKADRIGEGFMAQTGAVGALGKPFSPEALVATTVQAIARAEAMRAHASGAVAEPFGASPGFVDPFSASGDPFSAPQAIGQDESGARRVDDAGDTPERHELARQIAERVARAVVEAMPGAGSASAVAAGLTAAHSPESLLAMAGELSELVPALRGDVAFAGQMQHVQLGEILQLLQHQRQTGVLEVRNDAGATVSTCIVHGAIDLALGRGTTPELRLGRYLVEDRLVARDELERIVASRNAPRELLGMRLAKLGYASPDELKRALTRQTSELVYEALRWRNGSYRFVRFATRPEALDARLALPIGPVLMEGLRRVDEWRLIDEQIRSWDDVLRPDRDALATLDPARLSHEERTVLEAVDGSRSVRGIVEHLGSGSFEVAKALLALLGSRLVRPAA